MSHNFWILLKHNLLNKYLVKSTIIMFVILTVLIIVTNFSPLIIMKIVGESKVESFINESIQEVDDNVIAVIYSNEEDYNKFTEIMDKYLPEYEYESFDEKSETKYNVILNLNNSIIYEDYNSSFSVAIDVMDVFEDEDGEFILKDIDDINVDNVSNSGTFGGVSFVIVFFMYMLFIIVIQFVGQQVVEEKSTRAIEVIMTSVKSTTHMMAVIFSNVIFALSIPLYAIIFSSIIGGVTLLFIDIPNISVVSILSETTSSSTFNIDVSKIVLTTIIIMTLIAIGLLIISVISAALASTVSSTDELGSVISILVMLIVAMFIAAISFEGANSSYPTIVYYIPIYNAMIIPAAYISGSLSIAQVIGSVAFSILFFIFLLKICSAVYRQGVLNTSKIKVSEAFKRAFFEKNSL